MMTVVKEGMRSRELGLMTISTNGIKIPEQGNDAKGQVSRN